MWVMVDRAGDLAAESGLNINETGVRASRARGGEAVEFSELLENCGRNAAKDNSRFLSAAVNTPVPGAAGQPVTPWMAAGKDIQALYRANARNSGGMSDWEKYKDDQLLKKPGGDFYDLDRGVVEPEQSRSFGKRLGKNIADAAGNLKSFVEDLFGGSTRHYRDENNKIARGSERGFFGSIWDGIRNLGRAFSFGECRNPGDPAPEGFVDRAKFFFSHFKRAVFGDILQGTGGSIIRMAESLVVSGWNLLETVPDATIGNFRKGEELTTEVFDNGQVFLGYLMDTLPGGEAWARVHASDFSDKDNPGFPVVTNLKKPEREEGDARWKYIRNTGFRKFIETIGALGMDVLAVKLLGESKFLSEERRERN